MNDFRQYEEAIALYHNKLSINTAQFTLGFIMISCVLSRTFFRFKQTEWNCY
jgi:hypothetical protein